MADRLALRALVEQYAKGADNRSPELFGGAFTKDGVLNSSLGPVPGSEAIASLTSKLGRYRATMHIIGNHYVEFVDDDHATGETYCTAHHVYDADGVDRMYVMAVRYQDSYVRTADGWRIEVRTLKLQWDEDRPLLEGGGSKRPG
ncbi:MAG TPA: nuclear transport factor 2 family protein [Acidimicrobiales bacterium]|nr:nuclear transport factor 2 family protein [Acidimicrobiales bacterium]